jgi:tetratricopeptide (TPR) repeat protein
VFKAAVLAASLAAGTTLDQAKRAFDAGEYATAAKLFEKAQQQSKGCDIGFYLGLARYRLKQTSEAIIAFQSAVQCDPKLIAAHLALAEAYTERANESEALTAYQRALKLDPANTRALRGAASIYLASEANYDALPLLEKLVNADGQDPQARIDLAAAYAATGNREQAEEEFQQALRIKPNLAAALMGLGNAYLKKGQENEAIALLQRAAAAVPKAFEPHFLLGAAYNRLQNYDEALKELETAVKLGGAEPEVFYQMARTYAGLNRPDDRRVALARFAELTRRSKQDIEMQRRGLRLMEETKSLVNAGDLNAALTKLEEARELRAGDATLLFRLAGLHFDLQQFEVARNYVQEAISLAPSAWVYHYLLGMIEKSTKRWHEARNSLEVAGRLNPHAAEVHNALGQVALEQRDRERAISSFRRASELAPNEPAYRSNLEAARNSAP